MIRLVNLLADSTFDSPFGRDNLVHLKYLKLHRLCMSLALEIYTNDSRSVRGLDVVDGFKATSEFILVPSCKVRGEVFQIIPRH